MRTKYLLFAIILTGLALRLYQLNDLPGILNRDEAALAYNAYLLMETGKDEWSRSWPAALESFGDYKLPGYPLMLIPTYAVFGVNDFSVRLPSVIAGAALIPLAFWLLKIFKQSNFTALFGALLAAVAPVLFFYSRMAFEANAAQALTLVAICLLFHHFTSRRTAADLTAVAVLAAAAATYNTPLLLLPVIAAVVIIYRGIKKPKNWFLPISLMAMVFIGFSLVLAPLMSRKAAITIFTDPAVWEEFTGFRSSLPVILQPAAGNKYVFYLLRIIQNTLASFSPYFLVKQGGSHPWHSLPYWGHITLYTYALSLIGMASAAAMFFKAKEKELAALGILLVGSLAPSVVTVDAPHTTRSLLFLFLLINFAALGAAYLVKVFKGYLEPVSIKTALTLLVIICVMPYFYEYFGEYQDSQKKIYQTGFDEAISQTAYEDPVYIVDQEGYQYILAAWYSRIEPDTFFNTVKRGEPDLIGFRYGQRAGKYHFIAEKDEAKDTVIFWDKEKEAWIIEKN